MIRKALPQSDMTPKITTYTGAPAPKRVLFVTHIMTHYRVRFHELVRQKLTRHNVIYDIICGSATDHERQKGDLASVSFMKTIPEIKLPGSTGVFYHPIYFQSASYDLNIVTQENKYLLNYLLQIFRPFRHARLAFMGHGRNFQARNADSVAEIWKRFWATKVDWWFAYTDQTRNHISSLGFPEKRITVFNNSVDISELRAHIRRVTPERLFELRTELKLDGRNVGVFVGGLYPDKRLEFLIEAALNIRDRIQDFELLIIGGGKDFSKVKRLEADYPWLRVLGPRFGAAKAELMMLGHVFMMPGLVGLAILDAGAARLPIVTTAFPWHSPEIAYLKSGKNGVMVEDWKDPVAYSQAVVDILNDPPGRFAMADAAEAMSQQFSIEAMAESFANGILKALAT